MKKLREFISLIGNVIRFNQLPESERVLTFYSEGRNYWSYLGGLLNYVLENSQIPVNFVTSSQDDPGLNVSHPRLNHFVIGEGAIRDWMFANMDSQFVVMTMPDINQYQVKRSRHDVHYIYVQHSLVSFHLSLIHI